MTTTSNSTNGSKKSNRADQETAPSAELLEFLDEFSDAEGEWIDPLDLDDAEAPPEDDEGAHK
jgi:hypothetical protein